jgi:hypothetical protein
MRNFRRRNVFVAPVGAIWLAQEVSRAPMITQNDSCFSTAAKIADNPGYCYTKDQAIRYCKSF